MKNLHKSAIFKISLSVLTWNLLVTFGTSVISTWLHFVICMLQLYTNVVFCVCKDQIDHLHKQKIVASTINSKMSAKERSQVINDLKCKCPRTRLLYVTPEQANTNTFKVFDVHGSVHRNINLIERTNKMWPCSRIYYSSVS